jgi:hypothetical protein
MDGVKQAMEAHSGEVSMGEMPWWWWMWVEDLEEGVRHRLCAAGALTTQESGGVTRYRIDPQAVPSDLWPDMERQLAETVSVQADLDASESSGIAQREVPLAPEVSESVRCRSCGWECCKLLPGALLPRDLPDVSLHRLVSMLVSGLWQADVRELAGVEVYYLRPARRGEDLRCVYAPAYQATCVFLREDGCELLRTRKQRPEVCRIVIPVRPGGECGIPASLGFSGGSEMAAYAWLPHQELLVEAVRIAGREVDSFEFQMSLQLEFE